MGAAFGGMLRRDRVRWGMTEAQAARCFLVSLNFYRQLEAGTGSPTFETYSGDLRPVRLAPVVHRPEGAVPAVPIAASMGPMAMPATAMPIRSGMWALQTLPLPYMS